MKTYMEILIFLIFLCSGDKCKILLKRKLDKKGLTELFFNIPDFHPGTQVDSLFKLSTLGHTNGFGVHQCMSQDSPRLSFAQKK